MAQLDFFERAPSTAPAPPRRKPRYYQVDAIEAVRSRLFSKGDDAINAALVVKATGLGKTFVFSEIARQLPSWIGLPARVLVVAHREELITQARDALRAITGEPVGTEKAEQRAGKERIVVTSVQTMSRRLDVFTPDAFQLVITDEAHRSCAASYMAIYKHFSSAKRLGVTATPDRSDERALVGPGKPYDDVVYVMDIRDGIEAGYLVDVVGEECAVSVDLDKVAVVNGDLAQGELDDAMLGVVESVVQQLQERCGSDQAIVFTPGVKSAHAMCERMEESHPGSSIAIDGGTDPFLRRRLVEAYRKGEKQYLFNCAVATEGFDAPATSIVAIARPTKSRSLYAQMCGRGTRVLPGVVDHLDGKERAQERLDAIAASAKPRMRILDFVGNAGRHSLVTPVDVLGADYTEEEVAQAKKRRKKLSADGAPDETYSDSLKVARQELKAMAKRLAEAKLKVNARWAGFDPFQTLGMDREDAITARFGGRPATEGQREYLVRLGLRPEDVKGVDFRAASRLIGKAKERMDMGLATLRQLRLIGEHCAVPEGLGFEAARKAVVYISSECGGGKRRPVDVNRLKSILEG